MAVAVAVMSGRICSRDAAERLEWSRLYSLPATQQWPLAEIKASREFQITSEHGEHVEFACERINLESGWQMELEVSQSRPLHD